MEDQVQLNPQPVKETIPIYRQPKKLAMILVSVAVVLLAILGIYRLLLPSGSPIINSILQREDKPTVPNPLNGVLYTKSEAAKWQERPVLGVMIENLGTSEVRPQSGLGSAEVVYEALTEGGITRFMALYLASETKVGPIRSARLQFVDWIGEYEGLYAHVGGNQFSLQAIPKYGTKDLNQFSIGEPVFERDQTLINKGYGSEHTVFSTTAKLWQEASDQGYSKGSFASWSFKDDSPIKTSPTASATATPTPTVKGSKLVQSSPTGYIPEINVEFTGDLLYNVRWVYDPGTNTYKRFYGKEPHTDRVTTNQLSPKNVVVMFFPVSYAADVVGHALTAVHETIGTGKALIFQDGVVKNATWSKKSLVDRTQLLDKNGQLIQFNRGQIWIEAVPTTATVKY